MVRLRDILVNHEQIPSIYKEPFVLTGYRRSGTSIQDCLRYIFVPHNDVGNFWTHFIILWVWLGWLTALSTSIDLTDPYWFPLLALWFGGCSYTLCSSLAHLFSCISSKAYQLLFMLDYHAIIMYGLAECLAYYHYERPAGHALFEHTDAIIVSHLFIGAGISLLCCLARFWMCRHYRVFITFFSAVLHGISTIPLIWRVWTCTAREEQCIPETFHYHIASLVLPLPCVFFFISRAPERFAPGYFDYILQSHQLFHISCVAHTSVQMYVLPIDAALRKEELATGIHSSWGNGHMLLSYLAVAGIGVFIILLLHIFTADIDSQGKGSSLFTGRKKLKDH